MMISIVVGIMLSMFLLLASINQRQLSSFLIGVQLQSDLESSLAISQSYYFTNDQNGKWIKNSFNDDSIKTIRKYWGAYQLVVTKAKSRHDHLSAAGLFGIPMSRDTGLVVAESGRPVGLSGNIILKANCFLPSHGFKPVFIEGKSYSGSSENNRYIKNSGQVSFEIDAKFIEGMKDLYTGRSSMNDSLGQLDVLPKFISFTGKTLVIPNLSGSLSGMNLNGNIKLIGKDLVIDSTNKLTNVLIICRKVKFANGFKGNVHVLASDSIICERNCKFAFPSSFVLLQEMSEMKGMSVIEVGIENLFEGGIIALANVQSFQKILTKLNAESEVCGLVYSPQLHLEGQVNANLYCEKLLLKTPSGMYENHFMSCEIDPAKYAGVLSVPRIFKTKSKEKKSVAF